MARGKNSRRRGSCPSPGSFDGPASATVMKDPFCTPPSHMNLPIPASLTNALVNPDEIHDAVSINTILHSGNRHSTAIFPHCLFRLPLPPQIDFHWKNLRLDLKHFLLKNPHVSLSEYVLILCGR